MVQRTGKATTPETELARREKIRLAMLGRTHSEETRSKLRAANARQFSAPEARAHNSEITRKLWQDPEYRQRMVLAHTGKVVSESQRRKNSLAHKGMKRPPETGERIAAAARQRWAKLSKEERFKICAPGLKLATVAARTTHPTSIEVIVRDLLDSLGVRYLSEYPIGSFVVDFYVPRRRLVIECDGEYWHSLPGVKEKDARRDIWLRERGYRVLRLSESQIHSGDFGTLKIVGG